LRHQERRLGLQALKALDTFGLTDKADLPAGVLPYGDKKRVELARAFVSQPVLTLLDEPVAGLNPEETAEIAGLLRQLRQQGKTMLLVEHDMMLVMDVADQVVVLDGGKMIASGPPEEVQTNPLVLEAYLGRMSLTA
jgi:branched-chain amino acid transport system ATP-binding protein